MATCPNKNLDSWKNLVISRGETLAYFLWDKYDGAVPESESNSNIVNAGLKSVDILSSEKAIQTFAKGEKAKWPLVKILQELQIPKEQQTLILDSNLSKREEILSYLLGNYSYTIEINIAKDKISSDIYGKPSEPKLIDSAEAQSVVGGRIGGYWVEFITNDGDPDVRTFDTLEEANEAVRAQSTNTNSRVYSNLTVPGGTNYTENRIYTPQIVPSIKGHPQFAENEDIGWFRSDDKVKVLKRTEQVTDIKDVPNNFYFEQVSPFDQSVTKVQVNKTNTGWEFIVNNKDRYNKKDFEVINAYNNYYRTGYSNENTKEPKTRRILEIQSDLFQKGRDLDDLVTKQTKNSLDNFSTLMSNLNRKLDNDEISLEDYRKERQILEDNQKLGEKFKNLPDNQFLQLLNKDNNWVTFFIKSIVQQTAKERIYEASLPDIEEKVLSLQKDGKLKIDCK